MAHSRSTSSTLQAYPVWPGSPEGQNYRTAGLARARFTAKAGVMATPAGRFDDAVIALARIEAAAMALVDVLEDYPWTTNRRERERRSWLRHILLHDIRRTASEHLKQHRQAMAASRTSRAGPSIQPSASTEPIDAHVIDMMGTLKASIGRPTATAPRRQSEPKHGA
jgi:hypothetical protein